MENREFIESYMNKKLEEVITAETNYKMSGDDSDRRLYTVKLAEYAQCQIMYKLFFEESFEA